MRVSRIRNAILILVLCLLLLGAASVHASDLSGSGIQEDPYLIKTAADLAAIHNDLSAHYALEADIDLFGRIFEPIGNGAEGAFTGSLDGRGHTIRGLELDLQDSKYVGLFGYLEGSVSNLKLSGVDIVGGRYVGAVVGNIGLGGSATDCSVLSGSVSSNESAVSACVGGITGLCEGTLDRCSNAASVAKYHCNKNSYGYVGGLAGKVTEAIELNDSSNSGSILSMDSYNSTVYAYTGGLIGQTEKKVRLQSCSNAGVLRNGTYIGGLIGVASDTVEMYDCSNTERIIANNSSGTVAAGLIAWASKNAAIENSMNAGEVIGGRSIGGIIGICGGPAVINDCVNRGAVSANNVSDDCGGIAGSLSKMELRNCRNEGSVSSYRYSGGIVGSGSGNISGCSNYGNIHVSYQGTAAGILVGANDPSTIDGCVNYGDMSGGYQFAIVSDRATTCTVKNCRNYGKAIYFSYGYTAGKMNYSGNLNYGDLSGGAFGANLSVGSGKGGSATASIMTGSGIVLNGKSTVYCSDLRYTGSGTGYSLSELRNPASSAYTGWSLPGDWIIPEGKNSGLPLPKGVPETELMDETVLILEKGESRTLHAPFEVSRWSSNSIARCVDGTVTAQNVGSAVISAYDGTGRQVNCVVFVYEKRSVLTMPETCTVNAGGSVTLETDLPGEDPQGIVWSSADPSVASVDQYGKVTAKKSGQTVITASLPLSGVSASCALTVQGKSVTSLTLSKTSASLQCGQTLTLTCTTGSQYDDKTVTWSSSSDAVASVENGVVTAKTPGVAVITCRAASGVSASCTITVTQPGASLTLDRDTLTMELGTTERLTAAILPENTTDTIQWSSTNSSVVTVDGSGTLTAKGVGQAAVYAYTASGLKASCSVTVYNKNIWPETVTLSQRVLSTRVGRQIQLQAEISPSDCNHTELRWESSNPAVASVTVTGLVQTAGVGTAEIRVTTENNLYDVCTVKVSETSSAEFAVESGRIPKDGTADTAVYLTKNPGISAFSIGVKYDAEKLKPIAVQTGAMLASAGTLSSDIETLSEPGTLHVTWYSAADMTADGALFTVTWQALAADGSTAEIDLSYTEADICNSKKVNVPVHKEAGSLELANYLIGDIYSDNEVNMKDIVYFARWFNKQGTMSDQQKKAADVFYDHQLDVKDLTALAQLLSRAITTDPISEMSAVRTYSAAPEIFCLSVSDAAVNQNGEATLTIQGRNCPGVAALRFKLELPADCEIVSVEPSELLKDGTFGYNKESRIVTWYAREDHTLNGKLLTIHIRARETCPAEAEARIVYQKNDYFHAGAYETVPVTAESGKIWNGTGFAVTNAQRDGNAIRLTVKAAASRKVRIIVADYAADGKLLRMTVHEQTVAAGDNSTCIVPTQPAAGAYSAVFCLDAGRNVPLCGKMKLNT